MPTPERHTGLRAIAGRFDAFLIDQYGVLRDAAGPYPGAIETLATLKAHGARIIILSNSGKRAATNRARLARIGFDPAGYDAFVTSGETAWHLIHDGRVRPPGRRCLLITNDDDASMIADLGLERTDDGARADLVLIAGSRGAEAGLDHYRALLAPAAARGVTCLCTNPDRIMLTPRGTTFGPGRIADIYEELGGHVRRIGKPFPDIYERALALLPGVARGRILCIGDSVEHDIAGARRAGLASLLVRTGILADNDDGALMRLYDDHHAAPDFVLPAFLW